MSGPPGPTAPAPGAGFVLLAAALLLAALPLAGCGRREPGPPELETEVVEPAPGTDLSTADDERPRSRPQGGVAGVLPGGFPPGLPLYEPSSIVDFGYDEAGRAYVLFFAAAPPARVEERLLADLRAAGWEPVAADGAIRARRGGRRVVVRVGATGGGSEIRVEYRV